MKQKHPLAVLQGKTCYDATARAGVDCERRSCSKWINHAESHNCVVVAASSGPHTLNEIGDVYGLSRMRICQLEKQIFVKIKKMGLTSAD